MSLLRSLTGQPITATVASVLITQAMDEAHQTLAVCTKIKQCFAASHSPAPNLSKYYRKTATRKHTRVHIVYDAEEQIPKAE
jgi:hypothetical protein